MEDENILKKNIETTLTGGEVEKSLVSLGIRNGAFLCWIEDFPKEQYTKKEKKDDKCW